MDGARGHVSDRRLVCPQTKSPADDSHTVHEKSTVLPQRGSYSLWEDLDMRDKVRVLNPMGYPPKITQLGMAPRLGTLEGKTVYLVDCRFDDGDILMAQMQAWFAEHVPTVRTVLRRKEGTYHDDDPALFQEIAKLGDALVLGVGH
jgi:hypothetical protein